MLLKKYLYTGNENFSLNKYPTDIHSDDKNHKVELENQMQSTLDEIAELQDKLLAEQKEGLIILLQGMDAGGKDGTVKKVMGCLNPQGVDVCSFKEPTSIELGHDYLWRSFLVLPSRGKIAIFNRSYYEDVLIVKVHNLHKNFNMPERCKKDDIFKNRYKQIKNYEEYLYENGIRVLKIFLHLSKQEQKNRFLLRIETPEKNWKFSEADIKERAYWDKYQEAYTDAIEKTATKDSPWYIIPADTKWYAHYLVAETVKRTLKDMAPNYPPNETEKNRLLQCKEDLLNEK